MAVIGVSLGGAAALLGDDGPLPAQAMVLQAVYPDIRVATRNRLATFLPRFVATVSEPMLSYQAEPRFGVWPDRLSPLVAVRRYRGPVLVIGGGRTATRRLPKRARYMMRRQVPSHSGLRKG